MARSRIRNLLRIGAWLGLVPGGAVAAILGNTLLGPALFLLAAALLLVALIFLKRRLLASWAVVMLLVAAFWGPALMPRLLPEVGAEQLRRDQLYDQSAYDIALIDEAVVINFAHSGVDAGAARIDRTTHGITWATPPLMDDHAHFLIPLDGRSTVLSFGRRQSEPVKLGRSYFMALPSMAQRHRDEPFYIMSGLYLPASNRLLLSAKDDYELIVMDYDGFVAGDYSEAQHHAVKYIHGFERLEAGPDGRRLFVTGEGSHALARIDLETGALSYGLLEPGPFKRILTLFANWGFDLSEDGERLYLVRAFRNVLVEVDTKTLEIRRRRWVGGMPRGVAYLDGLHLVAVGGYVGGRIAIYDDDTLELRYRLRTCARVRTLRFDARERTLYWSDRCGVHRVVFPVQSTR